MLAGDVSINPLGAVRFFDAPDFLRVAVHYAGSTTPRDQPPRTADLEIPRAQSEVIGDIAARLQLAALAPTQARQAIGEFLGTGFRYSLVQKRPGVSLPPLNAFLTRIRSGHCEYFASATVLLLRAAGIPARYATGFSVQEYSPWQAAWLVRRRHAHSWALAYIDGAWADVDFTPAVWGALEAESAPWWESAYDGLSWLNYRFQAWRWGGEDSSDEQGSDLLWSALILAGILGWRLFKRRTVRASVRAAAAGPATPAGGGSPFMRIAAHLETAGVPARRSGETLAAWLSRVHVGGHDDAGLHDLLKRHYRLRFDPEGLSAEERSDFDARVTRWLGQWAQH
jgi:transglutaminase-like putative cysteine protease